MNYFAVLFLACMTFFNTTNPGWVAFVMMPPKTFYIRKFIEGMVPLKNKSPRSFPLNSGGFIKPTFLLL